MIEDQVKFGAVEVPGGHTPALSVAPVSGSHKRVIVLPGIHGQTPHILQVGLRLALNGFEAVIADFYCTAAQRGELRTPADLNAATQALDRPAIVTTLVDLVETMSASDPTAILGYCVGGAFALQAATKTDAVKAITVYYGVLRPDRTIEKSDDALGVVDRLACPVLGHYGMTDPWCPSEDVDELEAKLALSTSAYQIYRYPGAGHAFEEFGRPGFRPVAAADAGRRTLSFFEHYMDGE